MFGTALRSDWTVVSHQMIYIIFVFILLAVEQYDYFSVDSLWQGVASRFYQPVAIPPEHRKRKPDRLKPVSH